MSRHTREAWTAEIAKRSLKPAKIARSKYGNKKTSVDGIEFDSAKEARRYQELRMMQQAGQITDLRWQVDFGLYAFDLHGRHACDVGDYRADFVYQRDGQMVVEDVKSAGTRTAIYMLKRKIVEACHGIQIIEV